jgi:hypothetical protein
MSALSNKRCYVEGLEGLYLYSFTGSITVLRALNMVLVWSCLNPFRDFSECRTMSPP